MVTLAMTSLRSPSFVVAPRTSDRCADPSMTLGRQDPACGEWNPSGWSGMDMDNNLTLDLCCVLMIFYYRRYSTNVPNRRESTGVSGTSAKGHPRNNGTWMCIAAPHLRLLPGRWPMRVLSSTVMRGNRGGSPAHARCRARRCGGTARRGRCLPSGCCRASGGSVRR